MSDPSTSGEPASRRTILRDLVVFQLKLWLEGFKDVLLVPLSLVAGIFDLVFRKTTGRGMLYGVMRVGDRFETWVNLYGAIERDGGMTGPVRSTAREDALGAAYGPGPSGSDSDSEERTKADGSLRG